MNKWILPSVCFVLFIGCLIGTIILLLQNVYFDVKNQTDCENSLKTKLPNSCKNDKNCCTVWDGDSNLCRKGNIEDGNCISKENLWVFVLAILSIIFFIAFVVFIIMALKNLNVSII